MENEVEKLLAKPELPAEEKVRAILGQPDWKSYVDEQLRYVENTLPDDNEETLEQLICWFTDKKSKRVKYAGQKLRKLFPLLPGVERRRVGLALLTGSKSDTEWVCTQMFPHKRLFDEEYTIRWHPDYAEPVEKCWNRFHGKYCGLLMVQYMDEETVRMHLPEFDVPDFYFRLCRRFVNRPWFVIDKEKLKRCTYINAYLSVMSMTPEGTTPQEARTLLYQWTGVATVHHMLRIYTGDNIFWSKKTHSHRVMNAWGFSTALFYLLKMNLNEVVSEFLSWEEKVEAEYLRSVPVDEDTPEREDQFRQTILNLFPDDLKFLTKLDFQRYHYINTPGQILTAPQLFSYVEKETDTDYPPFGNLVPDNGMTGDFYSATGAATPDFSSTTGAAAGDFYSAADEAAALEKFTKDNPVLNELIEKLNLEQTT